MKFLRTVFAIEQLRWLLLNILFDSYILTEEYVSQSCQIQSRIENPVKHLWRSFIAKNSSRQKAILAKSFLAKLYIIDALQGSEYTSEIYSLKNIATIFILYQHFLTDGKHMHEIILKVKSSENNPLYLFDLEGWHANTCIKNWFFQCHTISLSHFQLIFSPNTAYDIPEYSSFLCPLFSLIRAESSILSLHEKMRVRVNPFYDIFVWSSVAQNQRK